MKAFCRIRPDPTAGMPIYRVSQASAGNPSLSFSSHEQLGSSFECFSGIFEPSADQDEVFQTVASNIVDSALNGFNGTIFAYGQTGMLNVGGT
jgi:hypothetical protein